MPKKVKNEKDNSERWLLTYSDLMNLLLILFIILYTFSKVDTVKYERVAQSLRSALGFSSSSGSQVIGNSGGGTSIIDLGQAQGDTSEEYTGDSTMDKTGDSTLSAEGRETEQMQGVQQKVKDIIRAEGLTGDVEVSLQEAGVVISIKEKVLFESGSADINQTARNTITKIGKVLRAIPGKQIRVEGHTDNDPIKNSRFPDNRELSTARANSVLRILEKNVGLDPKILSATGYGEYRPIAPNNTLENKAKNRRVVIIILRDKYDVETKE